MNDSNNSPFVILLCLLLLPGGRVCAQRDPVSLLRQLRKDAAQQAISYDYQLNLVHAAGGKVSDSMRGHVYSSGQRYIDSSSRMLSFTDGHYYCAFNHVTKKAYVYDLRVLERKTGTTMSGGSGLLTGLPDSLALAGRHVRIDSAGARYELHIETAQPESHLVLQIDKHDLRLHACSVSMAEDTGPSEDKYLRVCHSFSIRYDVDERVFASARFFSLQKGKVILPKQYAHYQLTQMTR
jgi:hypothetical protein